MDLLLRLYHRLRETVGDEPASSLTVADVYQQLIPYRSVRSELGVWELAAYEHALLRLLAGEGGYVEVGDEAARREIQRELRSPNPILGIYRDYADVRVHLHRQPTQAAPRLAPRPPQAHAPDPEPAPLVAPALPEPPAPPEAVVPPEPPAERSVAVSETLVAPPPACRACREPLPDVPDLRFCPTCGTDQSELPCASCGTLLRAEWNFCIRCGQRRADRALAG